MALGRPLWELRELREIVVPDETKKIENYWFQDSSVESVKVPKNVREIGVDAFYKCKNLRTMTFALGSQLEKIGTGSFRSTGIEKIVIPKGVECISNGTFS